MAWSVIRVLLGRSKRDSIMVSVIQRYQEQIAAVINAAMAMRARSHWSARPEWARRRQPFAALSAPGFGEVDHLIGTQNLANPYTLIAPARVVPFVVLGYPGLRNVRVDTKGGGAHEIRTA